jgi:hypothetical protein
MTDAVSIDKPVQPIPPAPEAVPEVEAAAPEAAVPAPPEANGRALPEVEYPVGSTRQAVLDHLIDSVDAGPQSVAQILAAMPAGTSRNTAESAIKREFDQGRIIRTSPGHYLLAPVKPPEAKPAPLPEPDKSEDEWFLALEAWINQPESWDRERLGPRPDEPGRRVPADIVARGVDRSRKRQERRKDAEAAAARREAEDFKLLDALLTACNGNYSRTAALADPRPIHVMLNSGVPIEEIIGTIKAKVDRRAFPKNQTIGSWSESWFLKAVAEQYARWVLAPRLVAKWRERIEAQAQGDVSTPETAPHEPVDASEASPATAGKRTGGVPSAGVRRAGRGSRFHISGRTGVERSTGKFAAW